MLPDILTPDLKLVVVGTAVATVSAAGIAALEELIAAELLQPEDISFVETVADVVTSAVDTVAYAGVDDAVYAEGTGEVQVTVKEGEEHV